MRTSLAVVAITFLASLALASTASASDVFLVHSTNGPYTTIQAAVDAAQSGDIVVVRPASPYTGDISIDGKGVSIVGIGPWPAIVYGTVRITGVPAGEGVLIARLNLSANGGAWPPLSEPVGTIDVRDCDGHVRVVDCDVYGAYSQMAAPWPDSPGGAPAVYAKNAFDVAVIDARIEGGGGGDYANQDGGIGGAGVQFDGVAHGTLMRSTLTGGEGGSADNGADGGAGVLVLGSTTLHISYSACFGGYGGRSIYSFSDGDGGNGIVAGSQRIWNFQGLFFAGTSIGDGADGADIITSVPMRQLQGHPSRLELPLVVREGETYTRRVSAVNDEFLRFERSEATGFGFTPRRKQPRLTARPSISAAAPSGPVTGTGVFGTWTEARTARMLPQGVDGVVEWQQAVAVDAAGNERRTSARPIVLLRPGF